MSQLLEKKTSWAKTEKGKTDRLHQLERTLLELGTELFRIKSDINSLRSFNNNFIEIMKGLQNILDEKGLISADDFEGAIDLGQAISSINQVNDLSFDDQLERIKKSGH